MSDECKIKNDQEFQDKCDWLVEKAKKLDHPLFAGEEREKLQRNYDIVAAEIEKYKALEKCRTNPDLRSLYVEIGILAPLTSAPAVSQKEQQEVKRPASNYADFLDD